MSRIYILSPVLPENELPTDLVREYEKECSELQGSRFQKDGGVAGHQHVSFIGRSYQLALQQVLKNIQAFTPIQGVSVRELRTGDPLPNSEGAIQSFVRVLQMKEGLGFVPFRSELSEISIAEGVNRANWRFVIIRMQQ